MNVELMEAERDIVRHALEDYLSTLREEIVKAENLAWKTGLHNEEDILKRVLGKLS